MENFKETPPQAGAEQKRGNVEITAKKEMASVLFHDLELTVRNPKSPEVRIVIEKRPIGLVEGKSYDNHAVVIDRETEKMRVLATEAKVLLELPENERPARVLEIFGGAMQYAYNDVVKKLSETDPDLAKWVVENTGSNSPSITDIPLSELMERGYGVCRHLAVAYLWLAQKAGLKGVILNSDQGVIKNIKRSDTKQKLFKSTEVGKPVVAHDWVEIKTRDGQWIPVDPSTKLVGDSQEGLAMFREANYVASVGHPHLNFEVEPREQLEINSTPVLFSPGEATASGKYWLELRSSKPTINSYYGEGKLDIRTIEQLDRYDLDIVDVKEE